MDVPEGTQLTLRFDEQYVPETVKLFELPADVLASLRPGEKLCLKAGADDEEIVLCTGNATFAVKKVESSNTGLLFDAMPAAAAGADAPLAAVTCASVLYEVKRAQPRVSRLRELLAPHTFRGQSRDCGPGKGVPLATILASVPASEAETQAALADMGAVEVDGRWFTVPADVIVTVFDAVLSYIIECEHPLDAVPAAELHECVPQVEPWFVDHIVAQHSKSKTPTAEGHWALDPARVTIFRVHQLFGAHTGTDAQFEQEQEALMRRLEMSLPDECPKSPCVLAGVALRCSNRGKTVLQYFPASALAVDPAARFAQLFRAKPEWAHDELVPYLRDLVGHGVTEATLLLKHTRNAVQPGGVRMYYPR